jgi:hypothetical protein
MALASPAHPMEVTGPYAAEPLPPGRAVDPLQDAPGHDPLRAMSSPVADQLEALHALPLGRVPGLGARADIPDPGVFMTPSGEMWPRSPTDPPPKESRVIGR